MKILKILVNIFVKNEDNVFFVTEGQRMLIFSSQTKKCIEKSSITTESLKTDIRTNVLL